MRKGSLYRIYPEQGQKQVLEQHFGGVRFLYNKLLHIKSILYSHCGCSIPRSELDKHILVLKDIYPWLKKVNSQSLQQANKNLDNAYQRFFKGLGDYPAEKLKKKQHFSFQVPQHYKINLTTSEIFLPIIGWIKINIHRPIFEPEFFETHIKTVE